MRKVHLQHPTRFINDAPQALCRDWTAKPSLTMTTDPEKVTCKQCLMKMLPHKKPPDDNRVRRFIDDRIDRIDKEIIALEACRGELKELRKLVAENDG
jgi:hypothetical protein